MSGTATKRSQVTACLPLPYRVPAEVVAAHVASETEGDRCNPDFLGTFVRTMEEVFGEGMSLELREALPELYTEAWKNIHEYTDGKMGYNLPHETLLMAEALTDPFRSLWQDGVLSYKYIPGSRVRAPFPDVFGAYYELTGEVCEHCGKNPVFYSSGGGVKCLNTRECGWWVCNTWGSGGAPLVNDEGVEGPGSPS